MPRARFVPADFNLSVTVLDRCARTGTLCTIFDAAPPFVGNPHGHMFKLEVSTRS